LGGKRQAGQSMPGASYGGESRLYRIYCGVLRPLRSRVYFLETMVRELGQGFLRCKIRWLRLTLPAKVT
jgi:hypothetical protein